MSAFPWELGMNDQQLQAIHHQDGPCVLLASAGSGKTRALVHRVARMVYDRTPADSILGVTFSKKAADEMNKRLKQLGVKQARIGTWHSLCLQILREDHTRWAEWKIDDTDRAKFILKDALGFKHVNWIGADLGAMQRYVGQCKAHLVWPGTDASLDRAIEQFGDGDAAMKADEAYVKYQELIENQGLLTFDDFLMFAWKHLTEGNRERWAGRWNYLLQDEANDANLAQVSIAEMLARDHKNYMVVGDCAQCIPAGEMVSTPTGPVAIEDVREGDQILSIKAGATVTRRVIKKTHSVKTEAFEFSLENGMKVRATREHIMFAAIDNPGGAFVYLMYRPDMGFRIGVSRTVGHNGHNFVVRTQQEGAERLWVLEWYETYNEAAEQEAHLAYQFQVPREPFVPRNGMWSGSEAATNRLFSVFGKNGELVLGHFGLDFARPNYFAKASSRGRVAINLILSTKDGHRVEVETGIIDTKRCESLGMLPTGKGTMRIRKCFRSLREARRVASVFTEELGGYLVEHLSGTAASRRSLAVPAASVNVGMVLPIVENGFIRGSRVVSRKLVAVSNCFDLEVEDIGNFIVGGVVVHNSIYGFRGSSPKYLHEFTAQWNAKQIVMNRNYRSGQTIVATANAIIRPAEIRLPEDMIAERPELGSVTVVPCETTDDEGHDFAKWIAELQESGVSLRDCVALYRVNAQSRALEEFLINRKIPYLIVGGGSFYERREVRDLLAYLRVASGTDESGESVARCINSPFRFLGKAFVERVQQLAQEARQQLGDKTMPWSLVVSEAALQTGVQRRQTQGAEAWVRIIDRAQTEVAESERPARILDRIITETRYIEWLDKDEGQENVENSHGANVRELVRIADRFKTTRELLDYIEQMMRAAKRQREDRGAERVLLMSIHRSKGLEWSNVWVCGCNEKLLPHVKGDPEEERRLMYVACTRARDRLVMSYLKGVSSRSGVVRASPSRFLVDAGLVKLDEDF